MALTAPRAWAIIAILAFAVYANALRAPFLLDDAVVVTQNRHLQGTGWRGLVDAVSQGPQTRALSNLTFYVNRRVAGTSAAPEHGSYGPTWTYHVFSIAVHALNGILVFTLLSTLLARPGDPLAPHASRVALGSTLLWLLHPVQTMAVTYIAQRYALLAATALLATLVCFTKLRQGIEEGRGSSRALTAGTVVCYLLCFVTKENAAIAPLLVVAIEAIFFGGARWAIPGALLGLLALGLAVGVAIFGPNFFFPARNAVFPDRASYLATESVVVLQYLKLWFWPSGLSMEHAFPRLSWADVPLALVVLAHALVLALPVVGRRRFLVFAVLWYYVTLAPESSFVPLLDPMVEHRLYLPSVLLAAASGWALGRAALALERGRAVLLAAWGGLVLALGIGTVERNEVYTPTAIWEDAIAKRPDSSRAWASLGLALAEQERWLDAIGPDAAAVELDSYKVEAWNNLGRAWLEIGSRLPDAPAAIHPCPPLVWARRAFRQGIAAAESAEPSVDPRPAIPISWANLGLTCLVLSDRTRDERERDALEREAALALEKAGTLARPSEGRGCWINLSIVRERLARRANGRERVALARGVLAAIAKVHFEGLQDASFAECAERYLFACREVGDHALALAFLMRWLEGRGVSTGSDAWLATVAPDAAAFADEEAELGARLERARAEGAGPDELAQERDAATALAPRLAMIGDECEALGGRLATSAPADAARFHRDAARMARATGDLARARRDYELALEGASASDRKVWEEEARALDR